MYLDQHMYIIGQAAHSLLLLISNNMELVFSSLFLNIILILLYYIVALVTNPSILEGTETHVYVSSGTCSDLHPGSCSSCTRMRCEYPSPIII